MNFPKMSPQTGKYLKIAGLGLGGLVIVTIIVTFLGSAFQSFRLNSNATSGSILSYGSGMMGVAQSSDAYVGKAAPELSVRNIAPMPPIADGTTPGNTAENFEVTNYSANIETRDLAGTCKTLFDLKAKSYVIFENATDADHSCSYTFKVERERSNEVVNLIKSLNPKDFSENTQTIQNTINDYTSLIDILTKKKESVEKTLNDAIGSYDEIAQIATKSQNADALAKIIDNKIQMLQQLTEERLNINAQLDQYTRSKADQLDQIKYTNFSVTVFENKFVDPQTLSDSWKTTIKTFVTNMNDVAQNVSINLVTLFIYVLQYVIYFLILLLVAKYVWRWTKKIWKM